MFSHFGLAAGHSLSLVHSTHVVRSLQTGLGAAQSAFFEHSTQRPSEHGRPPQSAVVRHWTQLDAAVSHRDRGAEHCASLAHPVLHRSSLGSQMGAAAPQSELKRHATHWPSRTEQRGALAGQFLSCVHCTHRASIESQIGAVAGQSLALLQPTQTPVCALQSGASFGHEAAPLHAG